MTALLDEVRESLTLPGPRIAREIREAAGVSQARLAAELGVHELTVHRWEAGARTPRGALRRSYARLLADLGQVTRDSQEGRASRRCGRPARGT
ncbi:MAG: helix-turn-helix domain-containing protein [Streptosporangiaceae bacterium]